MAPAKTRVPAVEGWFTLDAATPAPARHALHGVRHATSSRRRRSSAATRAAPAPSSRKCRSRTRGTLWSFTDNHYAAADAVRVAAIRSCRTRVAAVELERGEDGRARPGRERRRHRRRSRSACEMELVLETLYEDDDDEYLVWKWKPVAHERSASERQVAILGVGMHPWGKWGRNFVEYGVARGARRARRRRRRVDGRPVRRRRRHDAQRLSRLRRRRDLRAGARLDRRAGRELLRRLRLGRAGDRRRARADPRRPLRRRARRRRRHHAEGLLRAAGGRAPRRSRLAALPPARRHQPDLLRALRAPPHGALRRDTDATSRR